MIKVINVLLFVLMIFMNYLANSVPLNGKTTGELSAAYPNLFVPAGITFSIWGIIYLLLAVYCVLQFTGDANPIFTQIGWLFAITSVLNGLWILCWHYQKLPLSLLVMFGMLVALILINLQLKDAPFGLIKASFGIYLGWICIATIANVTAVLVNYNWGGYGLSEEAWAILLIATGFLLTSGSILKMNNPFIGLSVVWAFIGIALKRHDDFRSIFVSAVVALILSSIVVVYSFVRPKIV